MDELRIQNGQINLLLAPRTLMVEMMTAVIAQLALSGPALALDGGNCIDAYGIARALRRRSADLEPALQRIHLARAFTCYQMAVLLNNAPADRPTLVLDLPATFYDEHEPLGERKRLLRACLERLGWMSQQTQVVVSASLSAGAAGLPTQGPALSEIAAEFQDLLAQAAGRVWRFEPLAAPAAQLRLW